MKIKEAQQSALNDLESIRVEMSDLFQKLHEKILMLRTPNNAIYVKEAWKGLTDAQHYAGDAIIHAAVYLNANDNSVQNTVTDNEDNDTENE